MKGASRRAVATAGGASASVQPNAVRMEYETRTTRARAMVREGERERERAQAGEGSGATPGSSGSDSHARKLNLTREEECVTTRVSSTHSASPTACIACALHHVVLHTVVRVLVPSRACSHTRSLSPALF